MGAFFRPLLAAGLLVCLSASSALSSPSRVGVRVLTYRSPQALQALLARTGLKVERNLPALHAVVVADSTVGTRPVARFVSSQPQSTEPGVRDMYWAGGPYGWESTAGHADGVRGAREMYWAGVPDEWEYTAAHVDGVPDSVLRAAAQVKIAVVDTGCYA